MKRKKLYIMICCIALVVASVSGVLYLKNRNSVSTNNMPKTIENKFDKVVKSEVSSDSNKLYTIIISNMNDLHLSEEDMGKRKLTLVAVKGTTKANQDLEVTTIPSGKTIEDVLGKYEIVTDKPIIHDRYNGNHLTIEVSQEDFENLLALKQSTSTVVKVLYQE